MSKSILLKPYKIQLYAGEEPTEAYSFDLSALYTSKIDTIEYLKRIKELEEEKKETWRGCY